MEINMTETTSAAPAANQPATPTPDANQPAIPKTYKVKVDGTDLDVDEGTLIRDYQTSQAANKRFQEAAQTRAQAEEVLKLFKENPKLAFQKLGVDMKTFAEQVLNEQIADEMLTPDQRQLRDYKAKLDQIEAERAQQEAEKQSVEDERLQAHYLQEWDRTFTQALDGSGLPKTASTIKSMAYYMKVAMDNGFNDVTPQQVLPYVRKDYETSIKELFGAADENSLLAFLGDDLTNKVVKGHLNKMKPSAPKPKIPAPQDQVTSKKKEAPKSTREYFQKIRRGEA